MQSANLNSWVVHYGLQVLLCQELMKARVIEWTIVANDSVEEDALNPLLLDQKLVEAEETHDIGGEDLL